MLEAYFEKLWKSMPDRVVAVINAKGWYQRYWACNSIWFFFSLYWHYYQYLDTLYFWFEDYIIFVCGVILIFTVGECVCEGVHRLNHQDFCIVTGDTIYHMCTRMFYLTWDASPWSWCASSYTHHLYTSLLSYSRLQMLRLTCNNPCYISGGKWLKSGDASKFSHNSLHINQVFLLLFFSIYYRINPQLCSK